MEVGNGPAAPGRERDVRKIVLAYSGGLDTSVILVWLQEHYGCPVVAMIADLGQDREEVDRAAAKAERCGAAEVHVLDLRETFVRDYAFPAFRANAAYQGQYFMGSAIGRPLIAAEQVALAHRLGADAVAHGATGKGNDQVRFDLTYAMHDSGLRVIVPWRDWKFRSRSDLLRYAAQTGIDVSDNGRARPVSVDANLLHTAYEGEILEDPAVAAPPGLLTRVKDPQDAAAEPRIVRIGYEDGDPVSVDGARLGPAALVAELGRIGAEHGIGRLDLLEHRIFGFGVRSIFEAPAAAILWHAHRAVEDLVADPEVLQLKEELVARYSRLVYRGLWFAPERFMLQEAVDFSQRGVTGEAGVRLYRGSVQVIARSSPLSRYDRDLATFEDDEQFDPADASGWLRVTSLRLRDTRRRPAE